MMTRPIMGRYMAVAIPAIIVQLVSFKFLYPFASYFFSDSFSYIYAAGMNADVATWPIGYSKFLRVFGTFIHSDTGLVCFQYLFLQASALYLLFTLFNLFRPGGIVSCILFVIVVFNPFFLVLANSVSSDALFIGLSLCWFTVLLRMLARPELWQIFVQAFLLALVVTFRNNAFYYPAVAALAVGLSAFSLRCKLPAMLLPLVLIGFFVLFTTRASKAVAGVPVFSAFGGWQMANNALYMYGQVKPDPARVVPVRYKSLDSLVRRHFDTSRQELTLFDATFPGIYYLWDPQGPLVQYALLREEKDSIGYYYKSWVTVSSDLSGYGSWLIRQYPFAYARHFIWPNTIRYAFPPLEFISSYNSGMDTVADIAQHWFGYRSNKVRSVSKDVQALVLTPYRILHLVVNLSFLLIVLLFAGTKGIGRADPLFCRCMYVAVCYWLLHMGFSIFAAPVVLRYEGVVMMVCTVFTLLIIERLLDWERSSSVHTAINPVSHEEEKTDRRHLRVPADLFVRIRGHR